jgi:hypothetical protein
MNIDKLPRLASWFFYGLSVTALGVNVLAVYVATEGEGQSSKWICIWAMLAALYFKMDVPTMKGETNDE